MSLDNPHFWTNLLYSCKELFNHAAFNHGVFMLHEEDQMHKRILFPGIRRGKNCPLPRFIT